MGLEDTYKDKVYTTPIDIVNMFKEVVMDDMNLKDLDTDIATSVVQHRSQLMDFIMKGSSKIESYLNTAYGSLTTTPYAGFPISNNNNENDDARLFGISDVSSDAITQLWKITFTSATEFDVTAEFSGAQGSGDTSTKFTSTNSHVEIDPTTDTNIWSGTFAADDVIWFATYMHYPTVVTLTTMWALSLAIDSLFYAELPNETTYSETLRRMVVGDLKKLADPVKSGMTLGSGTFSRDLSPIQVESMDIDSAGIDQTDYAADDTGNYTD